WGRAVRHGEVVDDDKVTRQPPVPITTSVQMLAQKHAQVGLLPVVRVDHLRSRIEVRIENGPAGARVPQDRRVGGAGDLRDGPQLVEECTSAGLRAIESLSEVRIEGVPVTRRLDDVMNADRGGDRQIRAIAMPVLAVVRATLTCPVRHPKDLWKEGERPRR